MRITVVNKHHGIPGEYIGRGSPLGNPFSHMEGTKAQYRVANRKEAIAAYREYLQDRITAEDNKIIAELTRLYEIAERRPLNLMCFCAPKPCHGDVIKEVLLATHTKDEEGT